jgi:3-phytase
MRKLLVLLALGVIAVPVVGAANADTPQVQAALETEPFFDSDDADADDPAIWVHPTDRSKSIVAGTLKNGGLAVFDVAGETIQLIDYADEDARQNNVDLLYGVRLGGLTRDLAVVTERGLDHLRVFAVDPAGSEAADPLTEVTVPNPPVVFEGDTDIAAYGIAAWKDEDGRAWVVMSQRHQTNLVLVRLVAGPGGTVGFRRVATLQLPSTFDLGHGHTWTPCTEENGEDPQVEGMVIDSRDGTLYAAQEDVGLWKISVARGEFEQPRLFDRVREFGQEYTRTPDGDEFVCEIDESSPSAGSDYLRADAEGLTIYRLSGAAGYLLASSQGSSTFLVYNLRSLRLLGTFEIGGGPTDHVDESDGAMVVNLPLGTTFAQGLLVTHDGDDEPNEDATNFKFTRWQDVAGPLGLQVDTEQGDPRS